MSNARVRDVTEGYRGTASPGKLVGIARYFPFIGIVGLGGSLVYIAMMEDDFVGGDSCWKPTSRFSMVYSV